MRARLVLTVAVLVTVSTTTAGCGTEPDGQFAAASPAATPFSASVFTRPPLSPAPPTRTRTVWVPDPATTTRTSDGWEITVYYTAVEKFHDEDPTEVTGCPRLNCTDGHDDLGSYPSDFVDAVREEGTGRTASGRYLNWSYDVGFWLDSEPRTSDGEVLAPWTSAAADPSVLPHGTRFKVAACGRQDDGSSPSPAVCASLRNADWRITDEFTPGLGGPLHIDAYIGPETGPGFTDSDWYLTVTGARLTIG